MKVFKEHISLNGRIAPVFFLCGYKPGDSQNALAWSIWNFKFGKKQEIDLWMDFAIEGLLGLDISSDAILIRPLSNSDVDAGKIGYEYMPLSKLCKQVEKHFGASFHPELLVKNRETQSLKTLGLMDRKKELHEVYQINTDLSRLKFRKIWLIDDVLTTGTTAKAIWAELSVIWPDVDFNIFALARNTQGTVNDDDLELSGSKYRWVNGEIVLMEDSTEYMRKPVTKELLRYPDFDNEETDFL
jgi:hypoxanthine phosphoribosyltransferase